MVGEKDDNYVAPDDWTEDKMKEVVGIEKLVPLEIQVKDEILVLLFKPTEIIKELAKLCSQPEKPVEEMKAKAEEREVKADEEEKNEKESKNDGEKEEAPPMIDGKPVVFASMDIREKKAQSQCLKVH